MKIKTAKIAAPLPDAMSVPTARRPVLLTLRQISLLIEANSAQLEAAQEEDDAFAELIEEGCEQDPDAASLMSEYIEIDDLLSQAASSRPASASFHAAVLPQPVARHVLKVLAKLTASSDRHGLSHAERAALAELQRQLVASVGI